MTVAGVVGVVVVVIVGVGVGVGLASHVIKSLPVELETCNISHSYSWLPSLVPARLATLSKTLVVQEESRNVTKNYDHDWPDIGSLSRAILQQTNFIIICPLGVTLATCVGKPTSQSVPANDEDCLCTLVWRLKPPKIFTISKVLELCGGVPLLLLLLVLFLLLSLVSYCFWPAPCLAANTPPLAPHSRHSHDWPDLLDVCQRVHPNLLA